MRMSIDEALNLLNNSKPKSNNAYSIQMNEAINVIGVTMRKYQKIKEIVENNNGLTDGTLEYSRAFGKIAEVIEDGNGVSEVRI